MATAGTAGYTNLVGRTSSALDLRDPQATRAFFDAEQPAYVVLAAARVGGILANDQYPADFIGDNLAIQQSVITAAHETGVQRLLFLGSTCIYPKHAPQPMPEESLLTGPWSPRTSGTRWRRSRASSCARPTTNSTATISSR